MSKTINTKYVSEHISNRVFYIPFAYYFRVRLGTLPQIISWMLLYIFPTLFYTFYCSKNLPISWWHTIILYACTLIATFTIYESGYIANDTYGIKHEKKPTIRLYECNLHFLLTHKFSIILSRLSIIVVALIGCAWELGFTFQLNILIINLLLIIILFTIYNTLPKSARIWLYPLLLCSRFTPFLLPYFHTPQWSMSMILLLCSYPLCLSIERFSMPSHRYPLIRLLIPCEQRKTHFRVAYYVGASCVFLVISHMGNFPLTVLVPYFVLLLYRLFLLFYTHRKIPKNYLNG